MSIASEEGDGLHYTLRAADEAERPVAQCESDGKGDVEHLRRFANEPGLYEDAKAVALGKPTPTPASLRRFYECGGGGATPREDADGVDSCGDGRSPHSLEITRR